jgi:hypothetical protein
MPQNSLRMTQGQRHKQRVAGIRTLQSQGVQFPMTEVQRQQELQRLVYCGISAWKRSRLDLVCVSGWLSRWHWLVVARSPQRLFHCQEWASESEVVPPQVNMPMLYGEMACWTLDDEKMSIRMGKDAVVGKGEIPVCSDSNTSPLSVDM